MRLDQLRSQHSLPSLSPSTPVTQQAQVPASPVDQVVKPGEGAPVVVPGPERPATIGRGPGRKPSGPITLSPAQLSAITKVGAVGLRGRGVIEGKLGIHDGHAFLTTVPKSKGKGEVSFRLDLSLEKAKPLAGQTLAVGGIITKTKPRLGKVTGAALVGAPAAVALGAYQRLSGRVEQRQPMGIGGEAPPAGSYLLLDRPITVDGEAVTAVYLQGRELTSGAQVTLHGKLASESWGGVETRGGKVVMLSGFSDLTAGEPIAEDGVFKNSDGATLPSLAYRKPELYDAPGRVFVLDGDTVFLGSQGGRMRPGLNAFHGFSGRATISAPTDQDRAAVTFGADEKPRNAAGHELTLISEEEAGPAPHPDFMSTSWYYDAENRAAYAFQNGGIAGFHDRMSAVFHEP